MSFPPYPTAFLSENLAIVSDIAIIVVKCHLLSLVYSFNDPFCKDHLLHSVN